MYYKECADKYNEARKAGRDPNSALPGGVKAVSEEV